MTFLIQKEAENKIALPEMLELPLKRLSRYYLFLEVTTTHLFVTISVQTSLNS
jgi:hypothetical protein